MQNRMLQKPGPGLENVYEKLTVSLFLQKKFDKNI